MSKISFDGKTAIVTGAGGGLGRCHALELARRGANLVVNDLGGAVDGSGGSSVAAEKVVAEIEALGSKAISNGASVTDREGVAGMVEAAIKAFGRIDILVNNAGILRDKTFAKMELDNFDLVVDVHLMGSVNPTKAVWPIMREQGYGRILVTTSSTGLYGNFGQTNYGAAKLALVGFMNSLKLEGARDNIKINALAPVAATRMTENLMPPEILAMLKPETISPGIVPFLSEDAPTGQILCAGAGAFAMARIEETGGYFIPPDELTAEKVAENMDKIADWDSAAPLENGGGQGAKFIALLTEKLGGETAS